MTNSTNEPRWTTYRRYHKHLAKGRKLHFDLPPDGGQLIEQDQGGCIRCGQPIAAYIRAYPQAGYILANILGVCPACRKRFSPLRDLQHAYDKRRITAIEYVRILRILRARWVRPAFSLIHPVVSQQQLSAHILTLGCSCDII